LKQQTPAPNAGVFIWMESAMKKLTIALAALAAISFGTAANAADVPVRGPIYKAAPAPVFNWTGFYVGAHVGYGFEHTSGVGGVDADGVIGGFQGGYNWQFNRNWVFGVEADISFTNINDNTLGIPVHIDYVGTVRARLGYAWDRMMLYGTGGYGYTRIGSLGFHQSGDGFVVGAGLEWAFAHKWSAKVEYLFHDFDGGDIQTFKFGVNYRF
jgi:outer membrane immunogenic protein